jgi:hypothetical protein
MRILLLSLLSLAACGAAGRSSSAGSTSNGGAAPDPVGVAAITDEAGRVFQISQGTPGDPGAVGCADGQREAFVDASASPRVAGCLAEWSGALSLRAPASSAPCGDDLDSGCAAPADACGPGWHICGHDGKIAPVAAIGADACEQAGGGRFVAALSHCESQDGCAVDDPTTGDYACFERGWCSEPVCCGADCQEFGACRDGVWAGRTHIPVGVDQGCGAIGSSRARGVLCCR